KKLSESNVKDVERATKIPSDRMYKWIKRKGKPKIDDFNTLFRYFYGISSTSDNEAPDTLVTETNFPYNRPNNILEEKERVISILEMQLKEKDRLYESVIATKDKLITSSEKQVQLLNDMLELLKEKSDTHLKKN